MEYTKSVWTFPAESARKVGHPAPFPEELPRRWIALYTYANDVVFDPFMCSDATAAAATQTGRRYVGYGVSPEYCEMAGARALGAVQPAAHVRPRASTSLTITHAPGHAFRPACSGRS